MTYSEFLINFIFKIVPNNSELFSETFIYEKFSFNFGLVEGLKYDCKYYLIDNQFIDEYGKTLHLNNTYIQLFVRNKDQCYISVRWINGLNSKIAKEFMQTVNRKFKIDQFLL